MRGKSSSRRPTSQTLAVWSSLPVTILWPSGEKAADRTPALCPASENSSWPVPVSHTLAVWSKLAVTTYWPSREKATEETSSVCPLRVSISLAVVTSHTLAVRSPLATTITSPAGEKVIDPPPVTIRRPSGENATELIGEPCFLTASNSWLLPASHTRAV